MKLFKDLQIGERFRFNSITSWNHLCEKISARKYRTMEEFEIWTPKGVVMEQIVYEVGTINVDVEEEL